MKMPRVEAETTFEQKDQPIITEEAIERIKQRLLSPEFQAKQEALKKQQEKDRIARQIDRLEWSTPMDCF